METSTSKKILFLGFAAVLVLGLASQFFQATGGFDRKVLDRQFEFLRERDPQPVRNDVVVVGIDEDTFRAFREPFALWHPHLGEFLRAMAAAKPAAVGLDIVLPEHSFHFLIPQYDQSLLQGLIALRSQAPIVLGQTLDDNGKFRPIFPPYVAVAGAESLGSVMVCTDGDGVARRFDENLCAENTGAVTLAGKMADRLGVKQSWQGLVDYTIGDGFNYIPFLRVLEWFERGDRKRLAATFGGKPVLLGVVLPFNDRLVVPAPIAAWEPLNHRLPGVLLHAQALRSMLNHGMIQEVPKAWILALTAVAALFWFGRNGWAKAGVMAAFIPGTLAWSTMQLSQGHHLPVTGVLLAAVIAYGGRLSFDAAVQIREKRFLRRAFGSYVSPQILKEIMAGRIRPGLGGARMRVCVLFSDIRNFTARSEQMAPERVIGLLNDYFSEMTQAVHRHGGTVDKFIGDGLMAFFGAPQPMACAEKSALEAAQEMLVRLRRVNRQLEKKGIEPVRIGIGLHVGEVVVGHVGSRSRHEYTAIGDVVNTASRLEGLTKDLGYPVICSAAVAEVVGGAGGLTDLGAQALKGRSAMRVFGWNPPILELADEEHEVNS